MRELFKKIFIGDGPISEYATITTQAGIKEQVYLETKTSLVNVSQNQWVLCLEPLVFGVWIDDEKIKTELNKVKESKLIFKFSDSLKKKAAVAELGYIDKIEDDTGTLFLLELKKSRIYHFNYFKIHILFRRYYKKPKFFFKKFKSLVIAYSYPRKVRVISFGSKEHYNIFPMDLVGEIKTAKRMAFGLRHSNETLSKIIEAKRLTASEVPFFCKETIYKLGSHHGKAPPLIDQLPFKVVPSKTFHFYIPEWVESYKEIQILKTVNLGSHLLMWGEIVNETILKPETSSLYHVHFLQWLHQKGKDVDYKII